MAQTSVSITCYDRNGEIVKRVTSDDDGEVEDENENQGTTNGGNENENQNQNEKKCLCGHTGSVSCQ